MSELESGEVRERKTDNNPARLLAKVLDKIDMVLSLQGMGFREEKDWEEFGGAVAALLYEYYNDYTGGDSSYEPGQTTSSNESGESESESLGSDTVSEEEEEAELSEQPKTKKAKK